MRPREQRSGPPRTSRAATYAVLYGPGDEPVDWLRAGEALSAGWLAATEAAVAVLPYSSVVEMPAIRTALRQVISAVGYPYLVLRLGTADPDTAGPPHTPRLPASQTVEVTPGEDPSVSGPEDDVRRRRRWG